MRSRQGKYRWDKQELCAWKFRILGESSERLPPVCVHGADGTLRWPEVLRFDLPWILQCRQEFQL